MTFPYHTVTRSKMRVRTISLPWLIALLISFYLGSISKVNAEVDYTLKYRTTGLIAGQKCAIRISSEAAISIKQLPEHQSVTWLKAQHVQERGLNSTYILFIPRHKGTLRLPNLPVTIGGEELLLPIDPFTVKENSLSEKAVFSRELWNGEKEIPQVARRGQTFDLDLLLYIKKGDEYPEISNPELNIPSARWMKLGAPIRLMSSIVRSKFLNFGSKNYEQISTTYKGDEYRVRRYKLRFSVGDQERLKGTIEYSVKLGDEKRTIVTKVDIPILPLPVLPEGDELIHTKLIGNWIFKAEEIEENIVKGEPFTIKLQMEGVGDPYILAELPLAPSGFKSMGYEVEKSKDSSFDYWRGTITQKILPTGEISRYPELRFTTFDTVLNDWKIHTVQPSLIVQGVDDSQMESTHASKLQQQESTEGTAVSRPVLNNISLLIFLIIAIAPLLPFVFSFFNMMLKKRSSERKVLRNKFKAYCKELDRKPWSNSEEGKEALEISILPLLRSYFKLPQNSSVKEICGAMDESPEQQELSEIFTEYSQVNYTGKAANLDSKKFSMLLRKISLTILSLLVFFPQLQAGDLEEANNFYNEKQFPEAILEYEKLILAHPEHANLQYNLGNALVEDNQPHRARAAYHTALLLDPFHRKAKANLNVLVERLGESRLPGSHMFNMRPDQYLTLAAILWLVAWLFFSLRRVMKKLPIWPFYLSVFLFIPGLIGAAFWKLNTSYAPDQYMVTTEILSREKELGVRDLERLPLKSGTIITATKVTKEKTHILVESAETSFWLPLDKVTPIW